MVQCPAYARKDGKTGATVGKAGKGKGSGGLTLDRSAVASDRGAVAKSGTKSGKMSSKGSAKASKSGTSVTPADPTQNPTIPDPDRDAAADVSDLDETRSADSSFCADNIVYTDHLGYDCADWIGSDCLNTGYGYSAEQVHSLASSVLSCATLFLCF